MSDIMIAVWLCNENTKRRELMGEPDLKGNDELVECVFILCKHYGGCKTTQCNTVQSGRPGLAPTCHFYTHNKLSQTGYMEKQLKSNRTRFVSFYF